MIFKKKEGNTIRFLEDEIECIAGEKITTKVSSTPKKLKEIRSTDPKIAKVGALGEIEAVKEGSTKVSVRYKYGFEKKKLYLKVSDLIVNKLETQETIT